MSEDPGAGLHIVGEVGQGYPPPANTYRSVAYANTAPPAQRGRWLTVNPDGTVTAYAGKVEYGQGIRSGLAIEVAEELRVPLASVEVVLGDTARVPWDMGTFGSQSTARIGLELRKAAATAREALVELAVDLLDVPASQLRAADGRVSSLTDQSHSAAYADLVGSHAMEREINPDVALTPQPAFTVMGEDLPRVDAIARVTGQAVYSQDVVVEGMLFAAVLRRPARGARLQSVDASAARTMPGVVAVVEEDDLVAVLAETDEQAAAALGMIRPEWDETTQAIASLELPAMLVSSGHDP
ncbi:MAG TPA: molybdopterin cofactor-binding domain-containing protein, partial [Dehalococcoidia bacterium]|nr:molybdopterin cofactor-binding domain-containing protein [Dehalococcoidia bacterium]